VARITRERAERIAKAHACSRCKEYTFKKLTVKPAPKSIEDELKAAWIAVRICGVCGHHGELGLEADGDIVFES
jgi:transcription elongation factor Elf1